MELKKYMTLRKGNSHRSNFRTAEVHTLKYRYTLIIVTQGLQKEKLTISSLSGSIYQDSGLGITGFYLRARVFITRYISNDIPLFLLFELVHLALSVHHL